jgi:PKD repeat protein
MKKTSLLLLISLFSLIAFGQQNKPKVNKNLIFDYPAHTNRVHSNKQKVAPNNTDAYCIPTGVNCTEGDGFSDFELADISNLGSGCSPDGYGDFTALSTSLTQGITYVASFASGYGTQKVSLWIDFDGNDVFDESERLISDFDMNLSGTMYEASFDIPMGISNGTKTMRIRARYNDTAIDPCLVWDYGETEDYSVVIEAPLNNDVGILAINMDEGYGPGDITPQATVKNWGAMTQSFPVTITIGSWTSTVNVNDLASGEETLVSFDTWTASLGSYPIEVCTNLTTDENPDNDCQTGQVEISGADVGVVLIAMSSELPEGTHIPKVKVTNFAYETQSFPVIMEIGDYTDTQTVTDLEPQESIFVEFSTWTATAGIYLAEACTDLAGDEDTSNDCSDKQIFVGAGFPNFMAHETRCLTGLSIPFSDISTVAVSAWAWEFEGGDPPTSTDKYPVVTYDTPGIYDVTLTVTTPDGPEIIIKSDYISVADEIQADWELVHSNGKWISDIFFIDENTGYFCGEDGMVFKTEDSGLTWDESPVSNFAPWAYAIEFLNIDEGYVNGYQAKLMKTIDGGQTWEWITPNVPPACRLFHMGIWDSDHITIGGQKTGSSSEDVYTTLSGPGGFVIHTTPGGTQYNTIEYLSADTIVMQHFSDLTFSYDAGLTFESISNTILFGYFKNAGYNTMSFGSSTVGFMGGTNYETSLGMIAKTTDGGQNWVELREGFDQCRGSHFILKDLGFMVGHNGFVYKTIDGGNNWYGTHLPTTDIEAVYMVNENLVFIASRNGDVFRSENGFLQQPYSYDLSLNTVNLPTILNLENVPFSISGIVANTGNESIENFQFNYQVDGGEIFAEDVSGINPPLLNGVSMTTEHGTPWLPDAAGVYEVKVWVSNPNGNPDQYNNNDTITSFVSVISEILDNRIVLMEEATGTWCGYCPSGQLEVAFTLDSLNQEKTRVIGIALHGGDQFQTTAGDEIISAYGGGAYPSGWVDRFRFFGEQNVSLAQGTWFYRAEERIEDDAPLNVDLDVSYNPTTRLLDITENAMVMANAEGDFRFNCYILEDGLIAPQSNYYNNLQGHPYYGMGNPIPEFVHNHVLRQIIGETWGTQGQLPSSIVAGDNYSHDFSFTLPNDFTAENINVVGFISHWDDDLNLRSVVNANIKKYDEFILTDINVSISKKAMVSIFPNPFNNTFFVQLKNTSEKEISIKVSDLMGNVQLRSDKTWNGSPIQINTENLAKGIYFISVSFDDQLNVEKLVKQ